MPISHNDAAEEESAGLTTSQARDLYTSHFLSTWNARTYEFAAVSSLLFLALIQRIDVGAKISWFPPTFKQKKNKN